MPYLDPTQICEGPCFVLVGKSARDVTPDVLPADTVPFIVAGGSWGGAWRNCGFSTDDGFAHSGLSPDANPVNVAQQRGAATVLFGNAAQAISLTLLELTAENFKMSLGRGTLVSTGTSDTITVTDDPVAPVAIGIEAYGPKGKPLRILYPYTYVSITGDVVNRIGQPTGLPVSWTRGGGIEGLPVWKFIK